MATTTTRWGLRKPAAGDTISPSLDLGGPYDTIDANLGTYVCTSGTRPGSPVQGQTIYETDTRREYVYSGSVWLPRHPLTAMKTTTKSATSSTTLSDDTELVLPVLASTRYLIELYVIYSGALAADAKLGLTVPAGATYQITPFAQTSTSSATAGSLETAVSTTTVTLGIGVVTPQLHSANVVGSLVVGGTAGTCAVSWAQLVSNATASVLGIGSSLCLTRV